MEPTGRIWQPSIEPTNTIVPKPGTSQTQELYTRTSIKASTNDYESINRQNLNKEILIATQDYNNTPKPFIKVTSEQETATTSSQINHAPRNHPVVKGQSQQVKFSQQATSETTTSSSCHEQRQSQQQQNQVNQEENMAPKLVHKQYNSPIDLYSMNNIRKTIEAHTELIAPGLKGINFMKPEVPVNKQSEVYKLIKEEEEQQHRAQHGSTSSRLSPISGQPLKIPTALSEPIAQAQHQQQQQQQQQGPMLHQQQVMQKSDLHHGGLNVEHHRQQVSDSHQVDNKPVCCECGQFIKGPFAKIQNRFVHPHCFNCTTCGTSLKNTGYFTVNEKLYCDIHAKQVAKMMRIQYDFDEKQGHLQHLNQQAQVRQQQQQQQQQQTNLMSSQETLQSSCVSSSSTPTATTSGLKSSINMSTSPATISTMFADRSNSESTSHERKEIKWAWRPATTATTTTTMTMTKDGSTLDLNSASTPDYSSMNTSSGYSQHQQQHQLRNHQSVTPTPMSQQQSLQSGMLSKMSSRFASESSLVGGAKIPICVHCHVQIHGPYILAGKATWCKLCSQTNFHCNSCHRSLLETGFIEDSSHKYYCEHCFEAYYAPICSKCNMRIKGDCLNALGKQWHPSCFVCGHCRRPFGNSSFYLEDNLPYCERDWNILFTTKCFACSYPIEAGDKWIEALDRNYHSNCFRCTSCRANLEGSTFYCKEGKPYCRLHAR